MSTEYPADNRIKAKELLPTVIDSRGRIWASAPNTLNRFGNPFLRDGTQAVLQTLAVPGNEDVEPIVVPAAVATVDAFTSRALYRALHPKLRTLWEMRPLGEVDHELHDEYTVQEKARELASLGWEHEKVNGCYRVYSPGEADDANANLTLMAEAVISTQLKNNQQEEAMHNLKRWWPVLELVTLNDLNAGGDGLIPTDINPYKNIRNRTLKDSEDALVKNGQKPEGTITFFANNCLRVQAYESMANLSELMGLHGFAKSLRSTKVRMMDIIQDKFWWEDQHLFVPALDNDGKRIDIITDESAFGLFTGVLDPHYAEKAANRLTEPDLLTPWGLRTRSSKDPDFNLAFYQRGPVWPVFGGMYTLGALHNYGLQPQAEMVGDRTMKLVAKVGMEELMGVDLENNLYFYTENGERKGCNPHLFTIAATLGITASEALQAQQAA